MEIESVGLPKWPALAVMGKPVTKDQAAEIIVRTCGGFFFSTNDRTFEKALYEALGFACDEHGHPPWDALSATQKKYGVLSLEYLSNHRIASAYIGGPHGWCGWDGNIFANSYNIGKWPKAGEVLAEWRTIAAAFPYLDLTSQLFDGEHSEEGIRPLVEFRVRAGDVQYGAPETPMSVQGFDANSAVMGVIFNPRRERGCTVDRFKEALAIVLARLRDEKAGV